MLIAIFLISCRLCDVEKYCRAGQTADGSTVHAHCKLDN